MAQKRDNGQGSIVKRKDGRWVGKIQIGTKENGKPNIKNVYAKTQSEAKRKLKELSHELIKSDFLQIKRITVKDYMNNWLINSKKNTVKASSFDKLEYTLTSLINPNIGNLQIAKLEPDDIQLFVNKLNSDGFSYSTINQAFHTINDCFKSAVVKREVPYNPCSGVSLPSKKGFKENYIKFFTDKEVEKIIVEAVRRNKNGSYVHRLGNAVILLLYTGMRIGELLSLKWEDVDIENKQIKVKSTLSRIKNRDEDIKGIYSLVVQETKSKSGNRTIPLINQTLEALKGLKEVSVNDEFVITSKRGELIIPYSFRTMLNSILRECKIEEKGPHALRHTFASMLFKKGVDVKAVSELMGHADITITYNTYIHLIAEQKEKAILLLELQ